MRIYHQDMILFCPDQKKRAAKAIQSVLCYHVNDTAQKQCRVYTLPEHNSYQKSYPWHMVSVSSVEMISSLPQISQCHVSSFSQVSITSVPYTWCVHFSSCPVFSPVFADTNVSVWPHFPVWDACSSWWLSGSLWWDVPVVCGAGESETGAHPHVKIRNAERDVFKIIRKDSPLLVWERNCLSFVYICLLILYNKSSCCYDWSA